MPSMFYNGDSSHMRAARRDKFGNPDAPQIKLYDCTVGPRILRALKCGVLCGPQGNTLMLLSPAVPLALPLAWTDSLRKKRLNYSYAPPKPHYYCTRRQRRCLDMNASRLSVSSHTQLHRTHNSAISALFRCCLHIMLRPSPSFVARPSLRCCLLSQILLYADLNHQITGSSKIRTHQKRSPPTSNPFEQDSPFDQDSPFEQDSPRL